MEDEPERGIDDIVKAKAKDRKIPVLIAVGCCLFLAAAGVFFLRPRAAAVREPSPVKPGHLYAMDAFLVNLAEPDDDRYVKVKVDIESTNNKPDEEYQQRLPQLRDSIIAILSTKKYSDVFDSEGKRKLKEEIISQLNQRVQHFKVKTVYFTEFVVQ
jgi:flagellar protein FliL